MYHFSGSSVLAWPIELRNGVLERVCAIIELRPCAVTLLVSILSFDRVSAFTFAWRSLGWQQRRLWDKSLRPVVRPMRDANSATEPLLKALARNSWFSLPKSTILDMREGDGCSFDNTRDFDQALLSATLHVLGLDEEQATEHGADSFACQAPQRSSASSSKSARPPLALTKPTARSFDGDSKRFRNADKIDRRWWLHSSRSGCD